MTPTEIAKEFTKDVEGEPGHMYAGPVVGEGGTVIMGLFLTVPWNVFEKIKESGGTDFGFSIFIVPGEDASAGIIGVEISDYRHLFLAPLFIDGNMAVWDAKQRSDLYNRNDIALFIVHPNGKKMDFYFDIRGFGLNLRHAVETLIMAHAEDPWTDEDELLIYVYFFDQVRNQGIDNIEDLEDALDAFYKRLTDG